MNDSYLDVNTESLHETAQKYHSIADEVRAIFTNVTQSIDSITSSDAWSGDDSIAYRDMFLAQKGELDKHILELEQLGPTTNRVASGYEAVEEENTNSIRSGLGG